MFSLILIVLFSLLIVVFCASYKDKKQNEPYIGEKIFRPIIRLFKLEDETEIDEGEEEPKDKKKKLRHYLYNNRRRIRTSV